MTRQVLFQRVAYGFLALVFLCALFLLDIAIASRAGDWPGALGELLGRGNILPIVTVIVFLCGARELDQLLRAKGSRPYSLLAFAAIAILLVTPWLSAAGWMGHGAAQLEGLQPLAIWLMAGVMATAVAAVLRRETEGALRDVSATWLMILYLGFLGSFAIQLHCDRDLPAHCGAWLLLMVALVTKSSDIGAFLIGSRFGRRRLIPKVSPGKSVEGTIAGLCSSAGVAVLLVVGGAAWLLPKAGEDDYSRKVGLQTTLTILNESKGWLAPWMRAMILGVALSAAGQFGDLIESCFKRDAVVKDSGNVLPRFGGILDLIDSLVLAVPMGWLLLTVVWGVV